MNDELLDEIYADLDFQKAQEISEIKFNHKLELENTKAHYEQIIGDLYALFNNPYDRNRADELLAEIGLERLING